MGNELDEIRADNINTNKYDEEQRVKTLEEYIKEETSNNIESTNIEDHYTNINIIRYPCICRKTI